MSQAPKRPIDLPALAAGLRAGDRAALARAITLVESKAPQHAEAAQGLLAELLPLAGQSIRIGITGAPGAGKSTFIDSFGCLLAERGHKVAVLAIDPSSSLTRGSILGDKTRMERLARDQNAFIRPSPTGGALGGVRPGTRESILLCEAAGFDVIVVETVGTGQSEITLRSLVDFFLLLLIAGAGDELQAIKKGVIEIADALVINKADGDNKIAAGAARAEFNRALRLLAPATEGWTTGAHTASGMTGAGVDEIWEVIRQFVAATKASGVFAARRQAQLRDWLRDAIEARLRDYFYAQTSVQVALPEVEAAVMRGDLSATAAAEKILSLILPG
ncbi:MAG: methylmalonyl Co-A mutase-associated GTPase MeaB [Chloroflexota bacterium]|nr:methylmalonyl Co-A mutase-associated GTPase MeaB [Chloroflexota bacterium]